MVKGGIVGGWRQNKNGCGVDRRDRSVVRLSKLLVVDGNEKFISDICGVGFQFGGGSGNKRS